MPSESFRTLSNRGRSRHRTRRHETLIHPLVSGRLFAGPNGGYEGTTVPEAAPLSLHSTRSERSETLADRIDSQSSRLIAANLDQPR